MKIDEHIFDFKSLISKACYDKCFVNDKAQIIYSVSGEKSEIFDSVSIAEAFAKRINERLEENYNKILKSLESDFLAVSMPLSHHNSLFKENSMVFFIAHPYHENSETYYLTQYVISDKGLMSSVSDPDLANFSLKESLAAISHYNLYLPTEKEFNIYERYHNDDLFNINDYSLENYYSRLYFNEYSSTLSFLNEFKNEFKNNEFSFDFYTDLDNLVLEEKNKILFVLNKTDKFSFYFDFNPDLTDPTFLSLLKEKVEHSIAKENLFFSAYSHKNKEDIIFDILYNQKNTSDYNNINPINFESDYLHLNTFSKEALLLKLRENISYENFNNNINSLKSKIMAEQNDEQKGLIFAGTAKEKEIDGKIYFDINLYDLSANGKNGLSIIDQLYPESESFRLSMAKLAKPNDDGSTHYIYANQHLRGLKDENNIMEIYLHKKGEHSLESIKSVLAETYPGKDIKSYNLSMKVFSEKEVSDMKQKYPENKHISDGNIYFKTKEDAYHNCGIVYKVDQFKILGDVSIKVGKESFKDYFDFTLDLKKLETSLDKGIINDKDKYVYINFANRKDKEGSMFAYFHTEGKSDSNNLGTIRIPTEDLKKMMENAKKDFPTKVQTSKDKGFDTSRYTPKVNLRVTPVTPDKYNANLLVFENRWPLESDFKYAVGKGWDGDNMKWKNAIDNEVNTTISKGDAVQFLGKDPLLNKYNGNSEQAIFGTVSEIHSDGLLNITSPCGTFCLKASEVKKSNFTMLKQFNEQVADLKVRFSQEMNKPKSESKSQENKAGMSM